MLLKELIFLPKNKLNLLGSVGHKKFEAMSSEEYKNAVSRRKFLTSIGGLAAAAAIGWGLAGYFASTPRMVEKTTTIVETKTITQTQTITAGTTPTVTATASPTVTVTTTPTPTITTTPTKKVTLTHWHPAHTDVHKVLDPAFMQKYPWIEVKAVDLAIGDLYDKLVASFAAGSGAPDLFACLWRWYPTFVPKFVIDITDEVKDIKDAFYPFLWKQATHDGKIYGLPLWYCPHALWYRNDVFEKEGIDLQKEVETWDDFIEVGKLVTIPDKQYAFVICRAAYGTNHFLSILNSRAGQLFDSNGKAYRNNELAAEVLEWEYDLIHKHKIASHEVYFSSGFWAGIKEGRFLSWTMHSGAGPYNLIKSAPEQSGLWRGLAWPLWGKGKPKYTGVWGGGMEVITVQCKNVEEALIFLKECFSTDEALWNWCQIKKFVAPNERLLKRQIEGPGLDYCGGQNIYRLFLEREAPPLNYAPKWSEVETIVGKALDEIAISARDPKEAWKDAEAALIKLLGESSESPPAGI
jgi:ABC-type glycerol-3-phosphate transport system substrate-binding protein